jgi:hypothetical protein
MKNEITCERIEHVSKPGLKSRGTYHVVRPVFQGVLLIPFIPKKGRETIKSLYGLIGYFLPCLIYKSHTILNYSNHEA